MKAPPKFVAVLDNPAFRFWNRMSKDIRFEKTIATFLRVFRFIWPVIKQFSVFFMLFGLVLSLAAPFSYLMESAGLTISISARIYFLSVITILAFIRILISPPLKQKIRHFVPINTSSLQLAKRPFPFTKSLSAFDKQNVGMQKVFQTVKNHLEHQIDHLLKRTHTFFGTDIIRDLQDPDGSIVLSTEATDVVGIGDGVRRKINKASEISVHSIYFDIEEN